MAKIVNTNGKRIPKANLPREFCGDRIPMSSGEYMVAGKAEQKSFWGTYSIAEVLQEDGVFVLDGRYLYLK